MAITAATTVHTVSSTTNASTYASTSASLVANTPFVVFIMSSHAANAAVAHVPTTTCTNVTFAAAALVSQGLNTAAAPTQFLTLWTGMATSTSTGTFTMNFGGVTQTGCIAAVVQFTGADTTNADGSSAFRGSGSAHSDAGQTTTTGSLTFTNPNGDSSGSFYGCGDSGGTSPTVGAGWTNAFSSTYATPTSDAGCEYSLTNVTAGSMTLTSSAWGAVFCEVASAKPVLNWTNSLFEFPDCSVGNAGIISLTEMMR